MNRIKNKLFAGKTKNPKIRKEIITEREVEVEVETETEIDTKTGKGN